MDARIPDGGAGGPGGPGIPRAGFFGFTVNRPVAVLMITAAFVVFGGVSARRLPLNLMPDISYPSITIRTELEGAAPEDVERGVTEPIEEAVGVVGGLIQLTSVSRAGVSDVTLEFEWGTKVDTALQEIREKLDHLTLPREAGRPVLLRYDPNLDPILRLGVTGERGLVPLRLAAEENVRRSLESTPGVAAVKVRGGLQDEIRVSLHRAVLAQLGLDPRTIAERLGQENLNVASGSLVEGDVQYLVRTLNEFRSDREIGDVVVATRGETPIRLRDIASIQRIAKEPEVIARVDGKDAVLVDIYREADANIVTVADRVRGRVEGVPEPAWKKWLAKFQGGGQGGGAQGRGRPQAAAAADERIRVPDGIRVVVLNDQSLFVRAAISAVFEAAWQGALLAVIVLFFFLRSAQDTLIIGVAIPISLVVTCGAMHLAGISLNVMSLGGLALGVGMMVDSSIVILDSIARCRSEGDDRAAAAVRGTREVGLAVSSSVVTTVVVFFPIAFVDGIAGQIFRDQALTVCISLVASLVTSIFLVPMLASRGAAARGLARMQFRVFSLAYVERIRLGIRARSVTGFADAALATAMLPLAVALEIPLQLVIWAVWGLSWAGLRIVRLASLAFGAVLFPALWTFARGLDALSAAYPVLLKLAFRSRLALGGAAVAGAWATTLLWPQLRQELIPTLHQGEFILEVSLPVGTPIERTSAQVAELEQTALRAPHVARVVSAIGAEEDANSRGSEGENTARIRVTLAPSENAAATEEETLAVLRERFESMPDVTVKVAHPVLFSFRPPLELEVRGHDLPSIRRAAREAEAALAALPELSDVHSTVGRGSPEIHIRYSRARLAEYGLDISTVAAIVQNQVLGTEATKLSEGDLKVPVRVKGGERDVEELSRIAAIVVNPGGATPVRLGSVATFDRAEGPNEIRRVGHQRAALVRAGVRGYNLAGATAAIERALDGLAVEGDVSFFVGGQSREMRASAASLLLALGLAVFLVYVTMAAQFESLLHPFLILFTVPMGMIGVVLALWWTATPVSVVAAIGAIVLTGIAVNNGIVLIDAANQRRRDGMDATSSILDAARTRLRPVLMTSLTTMLGLLPMALGTSDGAELQRPLAVTLLGGALVSTVLTLVLIPVLWHTVESRRRP
ncbi:MAG: efflux RND transporter permease subunit [Candidatus Brocadiae bacterium]|nr:efflux RND transporter permease subunit [Candidatus Brocadiia bacterium]